MLENLKTEISILRKHSKNAYFLGSQLENPRADRDVDLFFVAYEDEKPILRNMLLEIQERSTLLLHPTIVTESEFRNNPFYLKLISNGQKIW